MLSSFILELLSDFGVVSRFWSVDQHLYSRGYVLLYLKYTLEFISCELVSNF
jgi:hypothetical protein